RGGRGDPGGGACGCWPMGGRVGLGGGPLQGGPLRVKGAPAGLRSSAVGRQSTRSQPLPKRFRAVGRTDCRASPSARAAGGLRVAT
ncbi:hypothetical protein U0070_018017, partial [Myodes glareolus]